MLPMLALACSTWGWTVDKAAVKWSKAALSVVLACMIGKATNSTLPQCFLMAAMRGGVFLYFICELDIAIEADLNDDVCKLFLVEGGRV